MTIRRASFCLLVGLLGMPACTPQEEPGSSAAPAEAEEATRRENGAAVVAGFVVLGPEVRSIKPCGEDRELWVIPTVEATEVYESLRAEPSGPVLMEFESLIGPAPESGSGAGYSGLLTVRALRRAEPASEGFGCSQDLSGFVFRATGQEPFWHLRVSPTGLRYSTPSEPETAFAPVPPSPRGDAWVYESNGTGPEPVGLRVVFEPARCTDSMVGSVYSWRATIEIAGGRRTGCAWEGALSPSR